jgi:drug/metabolite transporter (DMT)-like permease
MAKSETWYDSQANTAKLISYAALLVLLGSVGWAFYSAWLSHKADQAAATMPGVPVGHELGDYHAAMISVIGGIAAAAFLYGLSAIIDLLIIQCEALRTRR